MDDITLYSAECHVRDDREVWVVPVDARHIRRGDIVTLNPWDRRFIRVWANVKVRGRHWVMPFFTFEPDETIYIRRLPNRFWTLRR